MHLGRAEVLLTDLPLRGAGIVNLEGPVAPAPAPGPGLRLVNPLHAPAVLAAAGVRVAGVANNHAADAGPADLRAPLLAAGLLPTAGADFALLDLDGLRVAVTAHDLTDGPPAAYAADLARARAAADHLVVTLHVTGPASYLPRPELRAAVEQAVAAGATVVAAHGTHAIGPVERRGRAVIAWGLGNLVFDCDCTREDEALVLEVGLDRDGVPHAAVVPIRAGLDGASASPAPDPAGVLDLLEALGGAPLTRRGPRASF